MKWMQHNQRKEFQFIGQQMRWTIRREKELDLEQWNAYAAVSFENKFRYTRQTINYT